MRSSQCIIELYVTVIDLVNQGVVGAKGSLILKVSDLM